MATYTKAARTREHIFQTAQRLFTEHGYHSTSLKDIAREADVSTGTLYRYFPSKGDLLFYIRRRSIDHLHRLVKEFPEDTPLLDKLHAIASADMVSVASDVTSKEEGSTADIELALAVRGEPYASVDRLAQEESFREELESVYQEVIEDEQEQGRFDQVVDAKLLAQVIVALYFQAADKCIVDQGLTISKVMDPQLNLLLG